jgi:hypothetical protein
MGAPRPRPTIPLHDPTDCARQASSFGGRLSESEFQDGFDRLTETIRQWNARGGPPLTSRRETEAAMSNPEFWAIYDRLGENGRPVEGAT